MADWRQFPKAGNGFKTEGQGLYECALGTLKAGSKRQS